MNHVTAKIHSFCFLHIFVQLASVKSSSYWVTFVSNRIETRSFCWCNYVINECHLWIFIFTLMQSFPVKLSPNLQISLAIALLRNCIPTSIHLNTLTTLLKQRIVKVDRIQPYLTQRNITLSLITYRKVAFWRQTLMNFLQTGKFFTILLVKNLKLFLITSFVVFLVYQVMFVVPPKISFTITLGREVSLSFPSIRRKWYYWLHRLSKLIAKINEQKKFSPVEFELTTLCVVNIDTDSLIHVYARFCLSTAKSKFTPGITSCRLIKDNKHQVQLTYLLMTDMPKDAMDNWNNSDLQCTIWSILKKNPEFVPFPC